MENLIYDDEKLPELEIEELLTLDEMLEHQPSFVAFSKEEVHVLLQQLLGSDRKADTFAQLHSRVVHQEPTTTRNVLFKVAGRRQRHDDESEAALLEAIERARDAPNYVLQQQALRRAFLPLTSDEDGERPALSEIHANVILEDGSPTTLLEDDPISLPVVEAKWSIPAQRTAPDTPWVPWTDGAPFDVATWVHAHVRPTLESVLKEIPADYTLHSLQQVLERYGYKWESLDVAQQTRLRETLTNLDIPPHSDDGSAQPKDVKPFKLHKTTPLWDATEMLESRMPGLLSEDMLQQREDMYGAFLQSIPPMAAQVDLPQPHEIVRQLQGGALDIEDAIQQVQTWFMRWKVETATRFLEKLRENAPLETGAGNLALLGARMNRAFETTQALHPSSSFLQSQSEMNEVKKATDTTAYDGVPTSSHGMVFEELGDEFAPGVEMGDEEQDDVDLPVDVVYDVPVPPSVAFGMSEGVLEAFACAWTRLHRVAQATGLPCDPNAYTRQIANVVSRETRMHALLSLTPALSQDVATTVLVHDLNVAMMKIRELRSEELVATLEQKYPHIHKEWKDACHTCFVILMTEWWLDLMKRVVDGSLDFTATTAMLQYIPLWSPTGPPFDETGKSKTGVIYYITAVAHGVYSDVSAEHLVKEMTDTADRLFLERVEQLRKDWQSADAARRKIDRAKQAKQSLMDAIMAIKAKERVNIVPPYIEALLYLPGVLPAKRNTNKTAKWVQGCCAAKLDEAFEADVDWKDAWKDLHMIKQGLAKKRWSQDPRPTLRMFSSDSASRISPRKETKEHIAEVTDEVQETSHADLNEMLAQQEWIPKSHVDMLTKKPMDVAGWSKQILTKMFARTKVSSMLQAMDIMSHTTLVLSLCTSIAALLPQSLSHIQQYIMAPMKRMLRNLHNGTNERFLLQYCFVTLCALPSTLSGSSITDPTNVTTDEVANVREAIYKLCVQYTKNGMALTSEDIQKYITKKREQQKQISLAKMDVLSTEDRQILQDAKKLKLTKLVEATEMADTTEIEGIFEFRMQSTDHDEANMDTL